MWERTTKINKRRILNNDEITMSFISTRMFDLINKIRCTYESIFAALVRLNTEENAPAYLSVFIFRRVCLLIATRKLYNSSHQCNRYVYYHMTLLSRNVYGADIATSKLWLTTFLLQQGDYCRSLQNVNDVLSYIPPYSLYYSATYIQSGEDSKQLYIDKYCGRKYGYLM